jgi:sulfate permease, SulP family
LFPIAALMPRVTLSAVIMVVAIQHLDVGSLRLVRRLATGSASIRRNALLDLSVILLVATISVTLDIVLAVFIGIAIAVVLFVVSMSRSVVRRSYRCGATRSRRFRTANDLALLAQRGETILVMELQGALFFGTGEKLVQEIDHALTQETTFVILNLRRVNEIDSTGARALLEISAMLAARQKTLFLVLGSESVPMIRLRDFQILDSIPPSRVFADSDRAIEQAENELLSDRANFDGAELPLSEVGVLINFSEFQIATIAPRLVREEKAKGSVVFREGDPGRNLLMITKGTASAYFCDCLAVAGFGWQPLDLGPYLASLHCSMRDCGPQQSSPTTISFVIRSAKMISQHLLTSHPLSPSNSWQASVASLAGASA